MSLETVVTAVEGEVKKVETAVVADAHKVEADAVAVKDKVETEVKAGSEAVLGELAKIVAKLRSDLDSLEARIQKHNQSGGWI